MACRLNEQVFASPADHGGRCKPSEGRTHRFSERKTMEKVNEILIADRNPHIRGFLKRELSACGYNVRLAENGKALLRLLYSCIRIDLLVLDPDFPGVDANVLARKIVDRVPQVPVVLYCIRGADDLTDFTAGNVFHVEKNGQSIEILKEVINAILIGSGIHAPFSLKKQR